MKTKNEILDALEDMDAQILNGGFYFYYINVIEGDNDTLMLVHNAALVGFNKNFEGYHVLFLLLEAFLQATAKYNSLPKTFDQDELEKREECFIEKIEPLDDDYYKIGDVIRSKFEKVAQLLSELQQNEENSPCIEDDPNIFDLFWPNWT